MRDIYIIECCASGRGSAIINGKEFPVGPEDCYVLFPGDAVIHTADYQEPRNGVWCAVDGLLLGQVFARLGISSRSPFAPKEAFWEIYDCICSMILMKNENDPGADLRRSGLVYTMLGAFLRNSTSVSDKHRWIQKAVGIMETRYHEALSVQSIASEIGLERSYFSTLFKAETGVSPYAYLSSLRIRKASALLLQRQSSISDIASSVGLDPQNFARLFKKETGKTPKEYRDGNL